MEQDTLYVQEMIFAINSEDGETPTYEISTQRMEIFDTKTDTKDHSLLELGMKRQGLYYAYLKTANVKEISRGEWSWTSEFVPGGLSSLLIQTWNPTSNYQAQNALVLPLKIIYQMDDSAIIFFQNPILSCLEYRNNSSAS